MGHSEGPCITFVLGVYPPDEAPWQAGLPTIESHELLSLFLFTQTHGSVRSMFKTQMSTTIIR